MKARGYKDKVLVREISTLDTQVNGLHVVRIEPNLMVSGRVVSVGPDADHGEVKVGDRVWFRRECGVPVSEGARDGELLALRYKQIDCVGEGEMLSLGHWYQQ